MTNILKYLGVVALVVAVVALVRTYPVKVSGVPVFGALGVQTAENYDPYIRYNGGYNSALPIKTTSTLQGAATTITGLLTASAGELFSSTGTQVNRVNFGTCYVQASATTIAASSTATVDCQASQTGGNTALTGITAGDTVIAQFASTTPTTIDGIMINGASASTTAGFITMVVSNMTGTTFTWTAAASTTNYIVVH